MLQSFQKHMLGIDLDER